MTHQNFDEFPGFFERIYNGDINNSPFNVVAAIVEFYFVSEYVSLEQTQDF
eukprot:m.140444 g.140444  ORF g.140444 m.140444 type:complete len:51 (+) comp30217_c0_seq1:222-374(+)